MKPRILILDAPGINCDEETFYAIERAGGNPEYVMLSDIEREPKRLLNYKMLVFPGGFSYGDYLGAGKIIALIIKKRLKEALLKFIDNHGLIIGICNGFQIMVKSGLLPGNPYFGEQRVSLIENDSGRFEDRWVYLEVNKSSNCVFTKGIERLYLPVAHGEGKFVTDKETLKELKDGNQIVIKYTGPNGEKGYPHNPNGSMEGIAGICDPTGRIFGLMPHPERFIFNEHHPLWTRGESFEPRGIKIFENAISYINEL